MIALKEELLIMVVEHLRHLSMYIINFLYSCVANLLNEYVKSTVADIRE